MTKVATNNHLRIGRESIPLVISKGKRNTVRISFTDENSLLVETSTGKMNRFDWDFIESRTNWILKGYLANREENVKRNSLLSVVDKRAMILGIETPVDYISSPSTQFKFKKGKYFWVYAPKQYLESHKKQILYHSLRKLGEQFLIRRVQYWAETTEVEFNRLRIKDLRSKWGSCSELGNINLNWHLVLLEEFLIDYVIVHELMHLKELNHSPRYWSWVAKHFPDYKRADKLLKDNEWVIGILS